MTGENPNQIFEYEVLIRETSIDSFGHVNNARYLELFEEARWEIINARDFGVKEIMKKGMGPVVLEVNLRFTKEVRLREKIKIKTQVEAASAQSKTMTMNQTMLNEKGDVCCVARFVFGLFDLKARKLIAPTPDWMHAIGIDG